MTALKCGHCGRFSRLTIPVYGSISHDGPNYEACESCHPDPAFVTRFNTANRAGEVQSNFEQPSKKLIIRNLPEHTDEKRVR